MIIIYKGPHVCQFHTIDIEMLCEFDFLKGGFPNPVIMVRFCQSLQRMEVHSIDCRCLTVNLFKAWFCSQLETEN